MDSNISFFSLPLVDSDASDLTFRIKAQESGYDEVLAQFLSGDEPLEEPDLNGPTTLHCEICKKQFDNAKKYYGHLRVHSKENLWICDKCPDQSFSTKQQLMKHSLTHKPLELVWRCPQCSMSFESLWRLQQHLFAKHLDYRPHKCEVCDKAFHKLSDLKKHSSIHTDKKKYLCDVCDMQFRDKSNLTRHMTTHNNERPFSCVGCGHRYKQIASMARHQKNCIYVKKTTEHKVRKNHCRVCGMTFQYKSALTEHIVREHTPTSSNEIKYPPPQEKVAEIIIDNRTEDNIVDDILSAEDDYLTMPTQNGLLNTCNMPNDVNHNIDNMTQLEFLKDMNQLHMLDDELFYNDIDFESFPNNQMFNTNELDYTGNDKNGEILFDFPDAGRSIDQELMNALYKDQLPDELFNVPEVTNMIEKPNELLENPVHSMGECATTIFESDVDLDASTSLAANLNQLIGENNVQYISTEDDDTFIISLKGDIDTEQLTDMLNIDVELVGDKTKELEDCISENVSDVDNLDNVVNNNEPIVIKLEETKPKAAETPVAADEKQAVKAKIKKKVIFVCRYCEKVFNKRDNYKSHIATHDASLRRHACSVCGERFSYRSTLNKHFASLHEPRVLDAHACTQCDRHYRAAWMLKDHIERDHERLMPYECKRKDCGKKFYKKCDLVIHERYHTGERPYECKTCRRRFPHASHLRRHERANNCAKSAQKNKKLEDLGEEVV